MEKVVVTGGAGFVGSLVLDELVHEGYDVVCIDNLRYGYNPMLAYLSNYSNFNFRLMDLCQRFNSAEWKKLEEDIASSNYLIHLACLVGYPACEKEPDYATRLNVEVSCHLADLCKKHGAKLLYASSGSNYGKIEGICTEETKLNPLTHYARTKCEAEKYISQHCRSLSFRFATAFGLSPRLRLDLYINDMVYRALSDGSVVAYEPHHRRTFIYVTDMSSLFIHAIKKMERYEGVFNAGDEKLNLTKKDILEVIKKFVPHFYIAYGEFQKDEDKRDYEVSYQKLEATGFKCKVGIEQGIKKLVDYFSISELKQVGLTMLHNVR